MDQLKAMQTFISICDRDGFSAAGKALSISKAVVSKRISELEDHLGCRLLQRTTRRHHLTEEGRRYLVHCRETLEEISRVEGELSCKAFRPQGNLRVNAALTFGQKYISPLIAPFKEAYPQITIELSLTNRFVDLIEEGFDLALRIGGDPNSTMIGRRLGEVRHGVYASPEYLARFGYPKTLSDLKEHQCLVYGREGRWRAWHFDGKPVTPKAVLHSNNGDILCQAAIDGMGLASLPDFVVVDGVLSGQLIQISEEPEEKFTPVMAVYPARAHLPLKVRAFIDFFAERLENTSRHVAPSQGFAAE